MHMYMPFDTTPDERAHLVCTDYILPAPPSRSPSIVDKDEQKRIDEINRGRSTITVVSRIFSWRASGRETLSISRLRLRGLHGEPTFTS